MRARLFGLFVLSTSGCALDPSGLGEDLLLDDDAAVAPDALAADAGDDARGDTPPVDATVDEETSSDAFAAEATVDAAPADTARDAADSSVTLDAAQPDTLDAAQPDSADTSVTDTRDAAVPCTEFDGTMHLGHCYFPLVTARPQAEQSAQCQAVGAHLATVTTAEEQAVVAARASGDRWVGLVKAAGTVTAKTSFAWITGESSQVYDNWAVGDPNGGHLCARMQGGGTWGDSACTNAYLAVCERE